jgi:hypothetical protein
MFSCQIGRLKVRSLFLVCCPDFRAHPLRRIHFQCYGHPLKLKASTHSSICQAPNEKKIKHAEPNTLRVFERFISDIRSGGRSGEICHDLVLPLIVQIASRSQRGLWSPATSNRMTLSEIMRLKFSRYRNQCIYSKSSPCRYDFSISR